MFPATLAEHGAHVAASGVPGINCRTKLLGKERVEGFPGYSVFQEIRCRPKPGKLPR